MELGREQFMEKLKTLIGDSTDDNSLGVLQDFTDTFNGLETKAKGTGQEDWKKKYEENDASWRTKYKDTFFSGKPDESFRNSNNSHSDNDIPSITINDLFK
jgi:hypothetical protein